MSYPLITPKVFSINEYSEWNEYLNQNGYVVGVEYTIVRNMFGDGVFNDNKITVYKS